MKLNKYSKKITQDESLPAAQAMLYGIGLKDDDFKKPQVGIASTGFEGNPCNMHLNELAKEIKSSVIDENLVGLIFNTIGVSDGITNGTEGMTYSLISREIIADSIETIVNAQFYDGLISVVGCDKNMPGAMMAIGRLNRPSILVYGGTIKSRRKPVRENVDELLKIFGINNRDKIINNLGSNFLIHRSFSLMILFLQLFITYLVYKKSEVDTYFKKLSTLMLFLIFSEILVGAGMAYFQIPKILVLFCCLV